jgi:3-methylcrotonyl-CoA carboxylase alpha subunit
MIRKLLIANRGEIAVRVIRAAREMGIRTVAVYSDADADALHVHLADEAAGLGAPEPTESYLSIEKVIDAAKRHNCDAIHPGYGFLSERAEFSEACHAAGITFIGPSGAAMRRLGAKIDAKKLAVEAGVPVTPGYFEPDASEEDLARAAREIGFPVMLKASAGGGGRGMRIVRQEADLLSELRLASEEALKAFGDGAMMVEKLIERPRHIEAQALADQHGNVAVLFERECSIQRRHQKLIEEAPSPVFAGEAGAGLWPEMRRSVEELLRRAEYTGAGTVEFILDPESNSFYFLEVNARLQVEHPVTEAITGLDLVQWQIRIASGKSLACLPAPFLDGDRSAIRGWAIEARIVAEDPAHGFLPSIGKVLAWAEPKMPGVRIDTGFGPGSEISRYYDSLVAKVIASGESREQALNRLEAALLDFHVLGVKTNIGYLLDIIRHPQFRAGDFDTGFLGREFMDWQPSPDVPSELAAILPLAAASAEIGSGPARASGAWDEADGFRNARA